MGLLAGHPRHGFSASLVDSMGRKCLLQVPCCKYPVASACCKCLLLMLAGLLVLSSLVLVLALLVDLYEVQRLDLRLMSEKYER